jgi:HAD superfamily hydrolase (TIGR01549 family)
MIKAAFFDLDDTLCDDSTAWVACARKAVALGVSKYDLPVGVDSLVGKFLDISERYWSGVEYMGEMRPIAELRSSQYARAIVESGLPENPQAAAAMAAEYSRIRSREIDLFPDALSTLAGLRRCGVRLALITNGLVSTHVEKVERLGLDPAFDHVIIAHALGFWKPDSRIFEHALALCNVLPAEAAMVGDSITSDVGGAQSAGIGALWFNPHGRIRDASDPEPLLGELRSLGELLQRRDLFDLSAL